MAQLLIQHGVQPAAKRDQGSESSALERSAPRKGGSAPRSEVVARSRAPARRAVRPTVLHVAQVVVLLIAISMPPFSRRNIDFLGIKFPQVRTNSSFFGRTYCKFHFYERCYPTNILYGVPEARSFCLTKASEF